LNDPDVAYRWHHLADLPAELESRGSTELAALRTVWLEQREALQDTGLMEEFNQQLLREYAIEGGIIERAYTLDRGITQILIERGIDAALIPRSGRVRVRSCEAHPASFDKCDQGVARCSLAARKDHVGCKHAERSR
jgi:hypothetical protein